MHRLSHLQKWRVVSHQDAISTDAFTPRIPGSQRGRFHHGGGVAISVKKVPLRECLPNAGDSPWRERRLSRRGVLGVNAVWWRARWGDAGAVGRRYASGAEMRFMRTPRTDRPVWKPVRPTR